MFISVFSRLTLKRNQRLIAYIILLIVSQLTAQFTYLQPKHEEKRMFSPLKRG